MLSENAHSAFRSVMTAFPTGLPMQIWGFQLYLSLTNSEIMMAGGNKCNFYIKFTAKKIKNSKFKVSIDSEQIF
jgi:hypothetical protein